VHTVQLIYNGELPVRGAAAEAHVTAEAGDGFVRLAWDDVAERRRSILSPRIDFEGYRIYRSTDPIFSIPR